MVQGFNFIPMVIRRYERRREEIFYESAVRNHIWVRNGMFEGKDMAGAFMMLCIRFSFFVFLRCKNGMVARVVSLRRIYGVVYRTIAPLSKTQIFQNSRFIKTQLFSP